MSLKEENSPGHFCYDCNQFFHDTNPFVQKHKKCQTPKGMGICVDSKEFGKYHISNLLEKDKSELIKIIQELTK